MGSQAFHLGPEDLAAIVCPTCLDMKAFYSLLCSQQTALIYTVSFLGKLGVWGFVSLFSSNTMVPQSPSLATWTQAPAAGKWVDFSSAALREVPLTSISVGNEVNSPIKSAE